MVFDLNPITYCADWVDLDDVHYLDESTGEENNTVTTAISSCDWAMRERRELNNSLLKKIIDVCLNIIGLFAVGKKACAEFPKMLIGTGVEEMMRTMRQCYTLCVSIRGGVMNIKTCISKMIGDV